MIDQSRLAEAIANSRPLQVACAELILKAAQADPLDRDAIPKVIGGAQAIALSAHLVALSDKVA